MKKLLLLTFFLITVTIGVAQNSGLGFYYQAVASSSDSVPLANSKVSLRISLCPGQYSKPTWVETHNVQTDNSGSFGIAVGKGTRSSSSLVGSFKDINFAAAYYWMQIDIKEDARYRELNFAPLPTVPYSEFAINASFAGMIASFAGSADKNPAGWLLCDGREVSRTEYRNLFNAIGTAWGKGDGSTTFNLPDLRGMFLRGVSGKSGNDPDAESRTSLLANGGNVGNNVGSYQGDAIRNITGEIIGIGERIDHIQFAGAFYAEAGEYYGNYGLDQDNAQILFDASRAPGVTIGSDNRPQNVYVSFFIKY